MTKKIIKRVKKVSTVPVPPRDERRRTISSLFSKMNEHVESVTETVDPFEVLGTYYIDGTLIKPPYSLSKLAQIVEESSILPKCIQAMQANVPGFGYDVYKQDNLNMAPDMGESTEKTAIGNILQSANEKQSFSSVRKLVRWDIEAQGNGFYEITRYRNGDIAAVYRANAVYMRLSKLDEKLTDMTVYLPRDGKLKKTILKKRFRRYGMIGEDGRTLRWFKEFNDPRPLDALSGEYKKTSTPATEIIHIKCIESGTSAYGFPRWIGNLKNAIGANHADYVNYDVFRNQGIPPAVVTVPPGTRLTDESFAELELLFSGFKGVAEWNKLAILEVDVLDGTIDDSSKAGRIELKSLAEFRKDDASFGKYLDACDNKIRQAFRLPPLLIGAGDTYTYATAKASRFVAEESVFAPERQEEDEIMSATLFGKYVNYKIHTKGPEIIRSDELANMFQHMTNSGAVTPNSAINLTNKLFDLKVPLFTEPWADYPIMMVKELVKNGQLVLPEGIIDEKVKVAPRRPGGDKDTNGPGITAVDEKSDDRATILKDAVEGLDALRDSITLIK